ncbi:NnrS family protein [Qipengyuania huizhouensis]|uniref:NnrS family protein n=1 Tax=Qipengyuania huizhouensis TaxID=2867245 RepID=UPI001C87D112|nr:NnrS family protein [Qipengyuania huizhouensis]MBX7461139.1 NnrS family protein [Qipengyuania huizhouensis]
MDGTKRLALRREREARAPIVLQAGFRPFFLASAAWFPIAMGFWLALLSGRVQLESHFDPISWHSHEMIFGGVGAAMTGYLLTATPNWSGRLPAIGGPLLAMLSWWFLARLINATAGWAGPWPAALIDSGYYFVLAAVVGRESWHGKGRGASTAVLTALFAIACGARHLTAAEGWSDEGSSTRAGIAILVMLISLVGGKLIPSFTRNALPRDVRTKVTAQETRFDAIVNWVTAIASLAWIVDPRGLGLTILALAGLLHLARAIRWQPWRIIHEPSVISLHLAYLLLPLGLLGFSLIGEGGQSDIMHLLTAGAISCMILAVMARLSMTQTGRHPRWRLGPLAAVLFVSFGAILRVFSGTASIPLQEGWLLAGLLWMFGFGIFLVFFAPMLVLARVRRGSH